MQKLVIVFAWAASLGHGRRVLKGIQDGFASSSSQDDEGEDATSTALTSLLLAANPAIATRGARAGIRHSIPLMSGIDDLDVPEEHKSLIARAEIEMQAANAPQTIDGVRIGPPPDLPSLLLKNRIVYIGSPLVPEVTELVVAELLYLAQEGPKDIFMYINSPGSPGGTYDAFAITDTMDYIRPEIQTICVGAAYGTAAMVLANGAKGKRVCLPNGKIMLQQPRGQAQGQATDIEISAREVLHSRAEILDVMSKRTGQTKEKIKEDSSRTKYFKAEEARDYGIVDKVLSPDELEVKPPVR